jgi:hypothetical protein
MPAPVMEMRVPAPVLPLDCTVRAEPVYLEVPGDDADISSDSSSGSSADTVVGADEVKEPEGPMRPGKIYLCIL